MTNHSIKKLLVGLTSMAFIWALQAEAADVTWQNGIKPLFDKNCKRAR